VIQFALAVFLILAASLTNAAPSRTIIKKPDQSHRRVNDKKNPMKKGAGPASFQRSGVNVDRVLLDLKSFELNRNLQARSLPKGRPLGKEDFAATCGVVGATVRAWALDHKWDVRPVAKKFRNPSNAPKKDDERAFQFFESASGRRADRLVMTVVEKGRSRQRLYAPIHLKSSCVACHGRQNDVPEFIKKSYPSDRAFGFMPGELRALYSVTF
jgi:hypothetical protein